MMNITIIDTTLKSGLGCSSHWKWYYSKAWARFPICIP